jgi:hypothetical protein
MRGMTAGDVTLVYAPINTSRQGRVKELVCVRVAHVGLRVDVLALHQTHGGHRTKQSGVLDRFKVLVAAWLGGVL